MHIAHFTNTYKPNVNGVVKSVSSFRDALTSLGHNVFIFAQDTRHYEDEEAFIFRFPAFKIPTVDYSAAIPVSHFINTLFPSLKVDVIHSNHPSNLGDAAAQKAKNYDLPLVFTFHTRYDEYSHYLPFSQNWVKEIITREVTRYMERCQHIITPSNSIRDMLAEAGYSQRVTTIPTGIDLSPYREADGETMRRNQGWVDDTVLISVGRLAKEKNWLTLLQAVAEVIKERPDVRLVLLGDGAQRSDLESFAKDQGISDRVNFMGTVPFEDVPIYLKASDLFCFASVTETQGLVTMEAMAAGIPIVAVAATGTSDEIEHDVQGLLTQNDSAELAQATLDVLNDEVLYHRLQQEAIQKANSFDIIVQTEKVLAVYQQAIEDKKANRRVMKDK